MEDSLGKLDKLTQEEARMAAAEHMRITRSVGKMVQGVDERVQRVGERVQGNAQDLNHRLDQANRSSSLHYSTFTYLKYPHRKPAPR